MYTRSTSSFSLPPHSNLAQGNGGAIEGLQDSKVEVEYTTFEANSGRIGGAIYSGGNSDVTESSFVDNASQVAVRHNMEEHAHA